MPQYRYEVIVGGNDLQAGVTEAASSAALAANLQKKGMMVLSVEEYTGGKGADKGGKSSTGGKKKGKARKSDAGDLSANQADLPWYKRDLTIFEGNVKLEPLLMFTSQISSLIGAGVHLLKALDGLAKDTDDKQLRRTLVYVKTDVEQGLSLSAAISRHPKVFSSIYVNLVKSAEATGELDVILDKLTDYLEKKDNLRRKVKSAMTYPVVVLSIASIAIGVIIMKIIPSFEETYAGLGAKLPGITMFFIHISHILTDYLHFVVLGLVLVVFFLVRFVRTEFGKQLWDKVKIRMPVFGSLMKKSIIARYLGTLSILLSSGVGLLEAIELSGLTSDNTVFEKASQSSVDLIRDGMGIADAFEQTELFPGMVLRMIGSGEESGTLPGMLQKVTTYYEKQVEAMVDGLSTLIEPLMIVFLGIIIGAIVVALFMPIFNLGDAISGH